MEAIIHPPTISEEEAICKLLFEEVKEIELLPNLFFPYAFEGHYYAITKWNLLQRLFKNRIYSIKSIEYLNGILLGMESHRYFPTEDTLKLLIESRWIEETAFSSGFTWFRIHF